VFRFRLERVLHYRRRREEHLEREYHRLQALLQCEEESLETLQAACRGQQEQLDASQGSALLGEELQQWHRYYQTLDQQLMTQKALVLKATEALAAKRQELLGAWQEKMILEKLAEKAREYYLLEHSRRDQKRVDETALTRLRYER
jgi:flagellar export protein FliJ